MGEPLFALDIGTRSVVGIIGQKDDTALRVAAAARREHNTRSMLDGQIHDVPAVAAIIKEVKRLLEAQYGPLSQAAAAAAGRALRTVTMPGEWDVSVCGPLTAQHVHTLELSTVQKAQQRLAADGTAGATYYCVGYSVRDCQLDGIPLKSLVGQRGRLARVTVIATFLPRIVIDSLQAALAAADLEMANLTLEPIAAINILVPSTMRQLNLALVDIGAGTSDIAITADGVVTAYGMVPQAGDEVTEALSQQLLLDFNMAEKVKRNLGSRRKTVAFTDVLGQRRKLPVPEVLVALDDTVAKLAQAIGEEIIKLNGGPPQAVLLVGGGSLTPGLSARIAAILNLPSERVAIRTPAGVPGLGELPPALRGPDAVTPLGILKLAAAAKLRFAVVTVNDQTVRLFDLGHLTVTDALLAAGIDVRRLPGRPGLGLTVVVDGNTQTLPGTLGTPGTILVNGQNADLNAPLADGDAVTVVWGRDGRDAAATVADVVPAKTWRITVNGTTYTITPTVLVNGQPAQPDTALPDRAEVRTHMPATVAEVLSTLNLPLSPRVYHFTLNGTARQWTVSPQVTRHGVPCLPDDPVQDGDELIVAAAAPPSLAEVLGLPATPPTLTVTFDGRPCTVPLSHLELTVNGRAVPPHELLADGDVITYHCRRNPRPTVSDVLLAAAFDPATAAGAVTVIYLNGRPAEFTSPVHDGDAVSIKPA